MSATIVGVERTFVTAGLIGRLAWLVGNIAEARGRAIERWADDPPSSLLARGRPPFFYALTGPPTVVSTVGALLRGSRPPAVVVSATCTAAALGVAGILVRTVVLPLRAGTADREVAVRRWYRLNRVRMLLVAAAVVADVRLLVGPWDSSPPCCRAGEVVGGSR